IRKQLLEYDDVANDQRKVIYQQRNELMVAEDVLDAVDGIRDEVVGEVVDGYLPPGSVEEQWDIPGLAQALEREFMIRLPLADWLGTDKQLNGEGLRERVVGDIAAAYARKCEEIGAPIMRQLEKQVMLQHLDQQWKEHLAAMDYLRQGIHLRGYAQRDPKQEYKREAFEMFAQMLERVKHETVSLLCRVRLRSEEEVDAVAGMRVPDERRMQYSHAEAASPMAAPAAGAPVGSAHPAAGARQPAPLPPPAPADTPFVRDGRKIGRNELCPCGSGKKYKQCHGRMS
ncbi:MAG: SEC-C domain-containing protein, partial [Gammaproteobacteria bacterium]|nr:SEC-C domain-containing protein [Gammaproteobacteria bacterium]